MSALPARAGPSPRAVVRLQFARSLGQLLLGPFGAVRYLLTLRRLRADVRRDLVADVVPEPLPPLEPPLERALTVFVSCAEPSGETHAVNFVRALRAELRQAGAPAPRLVGLGGERLAAAGVELVGRPVERAAMGLDGVLAAVPYYVRLLEEVARVFRDERPDVVVPIDSPALHVPLGRIAKQYGLAVVHYITPQLWAWAPWRVGAYRAATDLALTILPFEHPWFERHRVPVSHAGHPMLDALAEVEPPTADDGSRVLALLPGSREGVIARNLPFMLEVTRRLQVRLPELRAVVLQDRPDHAEAIRAALRTAGLQDSVTVESGDLHASMRRARAALSVSGTILIDLLHHRLPAVAIYRLGRAWQRWAYPTMLTTPWFSSVNLLAARELYPEFCFHGEGCLDEVTEAVERAFSDDAWRARCRSGMEEAARRLGPPGASARAARFALAAASGSLARTPSSPVRGSNPDPTRTP